jgi:HD-GYP domain-containing protein (c-di-GMP phosphodiesterase class II)
MLSDRPYRAALSRSEVEDQLARYAGQEFDPGVVKVVLESRLLEDHAASLRDDPTFTTEWRQTAWRGRLGLRRPPRRAVGQAW